MSDSLTIPRRFNGPLTSGNGGYSAGLVAGLLDGVAEVSLRRPIPLDARLDVVRDAPGSLQVLDGETVVADARTVPEVDVDVPAPVSPHDARLAAARYRGLDEGVFSTCFVCGRARTDTFEVFAGAVEARPLVASPWTPPAWTAGADGHVLPEFVWAVLDCPTYFALYTEGEAPLSVLARFAVRVDGPVIAGEEHVVIAWPIAFDGRKHHAGAALLSHDGTVLATARALLIEPRA